MSTSTAENRGAAAEETLSETSTATASVISHRVPNSSRKSSRPSRRSRRANSPRNRCFRTAPFATRSIDSRTSGSSARGTVSETPANRSTSSTTDPLGAGGYYEGGGTAHRPSVDTPFSARSHGPDMDVTRWSVPVATRAPTGETNAYLIRGTTGSSPNDDRNRRESGPESAILVDPAARTDASTARSGSAPSTTSSSPTPIPITSVPSTPTRPRPARPSGRVTDASIGFETRRVGTPIERSRRGRRSRSATNTFDSSTPRATRRITSRSRPATPARSCVATVPSARGASSSAHPRATCART